MSISNGVFATRGSVLSRLIRLPALARLPRAREACSTNRAPEVHWSSTGVDAPPKKMPCVSLSLRTFGVFLQHSRAGESHPAGPSQTNRCSFSSRNTFGPSLAETTIKLKPQHSTRNKRQHGYSMRRVVRRDTFCLLYWSSIKQFPRHVNNVQRECHGLSLWQQNQVIYIYIVIGGSMSFLSLHRITHKS